VVLSDISEALERERTELAQKDILAALSKSLKDRKGFADFFGEVSGLVANIEQVAATELVWLKRAVHTVKGNCAVFGIMTVAKTCHELETLLAETEGMPPREQLGPLLRAWADFASEIRPLVGLDESSSLAVDTIDYEHLLCNVRHRNRHTELAALLESWPHERAAKRLDRIAEQIRALALRWGYDAPEITVEGNDARFPTEQWAEFWGVFPHIYRNALDHGIERGDERQHTGKPRGGRIRIATKAVDEKFIIEFQDDGRGIDWDKLRAKAFAKGLPTANQEDLIDAMFIDGVSIRETADNRSGRGLGLSAVRQAARAMHGRIEVESDGRTGTLLRLVFPLTSVWIPSDPTGPTKQIVAE